MFTLKFRKSKSKNYPLVSKLANHFNEHIIDDETHIIHISVKELFEKWDYFNLIFWKSVDWAGSTFGYDGYDLHSHSDKTRLFYALQLAHSNFVCLSVHYLEAIAPLYFYPDMDEQLRAKIFNEQDGDKILDLLLVEKNRIEFEKEYGHLKEK